ncbi:helix-turn-helix transcriptional regulator [Candidatus Saccharibacteria bacterium]|nr:MAG: helix-turn-helix transcriptional regulator [Candidatus Saccharibacteria bacterium]
MADKDTSTPYRPLGARLRKLREQRRESLAEVSGAVEIEENQLQNIERGKDRPSEDILLLLISHFGIGEDHADELWELAGYDARYDHDHDHGQDDHEHTASDQGDMKRTAAMMIMLDPRVMYSDSVEVVSNKQGVIVNFSQTAGPNNPPLTVSRIGMSYDQAKAVMGILHQVLYARDNPGHTRRLKDGL